MTFVFFILSYLDVPWVSVMGQSVFHWVLTTKIIHVYLEGDTVLLLHEELPETAWIAHKGIVVTGMKSLMVQCLNCPAEGAGNMKR